MSKPRIIAGKYKGGELLVPISSRPVTDRIKQSVFGLLGLDVSEMSEHSNVLDLYAGSGSFGLEALSRGVGNATFVEQDDEAVQLLSENIRHLKVPATNIEIIHSQVETYLASNTSEFDLVFADPPFATATSFPIQLIPDKLSKQGLLVLRLPKQAQSPKYPQLKLLYTKKYGESTLYFLGKAEQSQK